MFCLLSIGRFVHHRSSSSLAFKWILNDTSRKLGCVSLKDRRSGGARLKYNPSRRLHSQEAYCSSYSIPTEISLKFRRSSVRFSIRIAFNRHSETAYDFLTCAQDSCLRRNGLWSESESVFSTTALLYEDVPLPALGTSLASWFRAGIFQTGRPPGGPRFVIFIYLFFPRVQPQKSPFCLSK